MYISFHLKLRPILMRYKEFISCDNTFLDRIREIDGDDFLMLTFPK